MPSKKKIKVLLVGAGDAGRLLAQNIIKRRQSPFEIIGFVDDSKKLAGKKVAKLPVLGKIDDLEELVSEHKVSELIIAIPSQRGEVTRRVIENTVGLKLRYKILPRRAEVLLQDFSEDYLKYVRQVWAEDLLGGEISKSDQKDISKFTKNKTILITGAAGSIGSELSRQIAAHDAKKIIFYDWWENGMFMLRNELIESVGSEKKLEFVIGDIKDHRKLHDLMEKYKPELVFHAAAYKHVPLMESNPSEAIKNNILGTKTVAEVAILSGVKKFVLISSDKAVNPTNVMGASKRSAEMLIHSLSQGQDTTEFCAVRFGNVTNSSGSVIPIFNGQIEKGGPVTVTHEEITRYFMTIPEAVHLILQASILGEGGDLFVLDMGEPVRIFDLAKLIIAMNGYVPEVDVKIKITGLRPGEKLYEEVLVKEEEVKSTAIKKIFRTKNHVDFKPDKFMNDIDLLLDSVEDHSPEELRKEIKKIVPTYKPAKH